jgi:hypothetical protein
MERDGIWRSSNSDRLCHFEKSRKIGNISIHDSLNKMSIEVFIHFVLDYENVSEIYAANISTTKICNTHGTWLNSYEKWELNLIKFGPFSFQ